MKNISLIIALTVLVSCGPAEWEKNGFLSEGYYDLAKEMGITESEEFNSYTRSGCWDTDDPVNLDNVNQFRKSPETCFDTPADRKKAKEYNIYNKEEWLSANESTKLGGFYSIDNYFKAKELDIKTQAELTKYEYNKMILSGMRNAGSYFAVNAMCSDISRYLIVTTNNYSDQRLFISLEKLFDGKNRLDMSSISPLNDDESREFDKAKNNEFGSFYNQLSANASNQKWLMDYLTKNCAPRMIQICQVSRAKNDTSVVKTCDDLSAYGL